MLADTKPESKIITWNELSSDWINWADRLAPAAEKINRHMIAAVDLEGRALARGGAPLKVLDLASGVGEPAFSFARALGNNDDDSANIPGISGHVTASDIIPDMCDALSNAQPGTVLPTCPPFRRIWKNCLFPIKVLMWCHAGSV